VHSIMDGAALMRHLEALIQFGDVTGQSTEDENGPMDYQMDLTEMNYDGGYNNEGEWNEPISLNTQPYNTNIMQNTMQKLDVFPILPLPLINGFPSSQSMNNSFAMNNQVNATMMNQLGTMAMSMGVMNHQLISQPFLPSSPFSCTPPIVPINVMPSYNSTQFIQPMYGEVAVDGYTTTNAATAAMPPSNPTQRVNSHSMYGEMAIDGYNPTAAPSPTISPTDSIQRLSTQPIHDKMSMDGYNATVAAAPTVSRCQSTQPIRIPSLTIEDYPKFDTVDTAMSSPDQMKMTSSPIRPIKKSLPLKNLIERDDNEADSKPVPQIDKLIYMLTDLDESKQQEQPNKKKNKKKKTESHVDPNPFWTPNEYTGLDALFDFSLANPLKLYREAPKEKVEEKKKPAVIELHPAVCINEPVVVKEDGMEKSLVDSFSNPSEDTVEKRVYHTFKAAGEQERKMRDFISNESISLCPFGCAKKPVTHSIKRAHLRKYHYDVYYKYCRSSKNRVEEMKSRQLGPERGDRFCLICDEQCKNQKEMAKHLEKNHRSAFERYEKELEAANQKDLEWTKIR
ncbi:hypothetical protein PENTCL1PPCAC_1996, partial [Pristionchus entomophagus]